MKNIAVLVFDLTTEYNDTVVDGIVNYFNDRDDVRLFILPVNVPHATTYEYDYQYWTAAQIIKSQNIDAIIVVANSFFGTLSKDELSEYLKFALPKPIISVSVPLNLSTNKYTSISCEQSYEQIVEHLVRKHNKTKIAFFSASLSHSPESKERLLAYKKALKKAGLPFDKNLVFPGDFTPGVAFDYIVNNYKSKDQINFDAILCANDYTAVGCLGGLQEIGVSVPDDICMFGFDDSEIATICSPTLSTVNQHVGDTGFEAARIADCVINKKRVAKNIVIQAQPLYRQTCGCINSKVKTLSWLDEKEVFHDGISSIKTQKALFGNGIDDMANAFHLLNMSDTDKNMNEYFEALKNNLQRMKIKNAAFCIYDDPVSLKIEDDFTMPDKVNLLYLFDEQHNIAQNYWDNIISFNPYESPLPTELFNFSEGKYIILPIFLRDKNYGYIMCQLPDNKYPFFSIFFKILINSFVHSYEFSRGQIQTANLVQSNLNLNRQSKTDELTGVLNRRGLFEYGSRLIELAVVKKTEGVVFFCDMDGLKTINDTYGHKVGDLAIKTEAEVLKAVFRQTDLVGRISGDEFGIIAPGFKMRKVEDFRKKLIKYNKEISKKNNLPFTLSISIGPAHFDSENYDLQSLLKQADRSLYEEKNLKHTQNINKRK